MVVFLGHGEGGAPPQGGGVAMGGDGGGEGFEFGVDPATDPELALALRISMEEERRRQDAAGEKKKNPLL